MNELINQITKESGLEIYGLGHDRIKWQTRVTRFTNLIVQECITSLEASKHRDPSTDTSDVYNCEYNDDIDLHILGLQRLFEGD